MIGCVIECCGIVGDVVIVGLGVVGICVELSVVCECVECVCVKGEWGDGCVNGVDDDVRWIEVRVCV